MPLLLIPLFLLAIVALVPIGIIQRYRVGTSRQRARGWLAAINLVGVGLSTLLFLVGAAITSYWLPHAFTYSLAGLAAGGVLGGLGLLLTRWERTPGALHYTPNRLLVLAITLVVTARILYGFWRGLHSWRAGLDGSAWFGASGVAGSMAAGAIVLGYYLVFWLGIRARLKRV